MKPFNIYCIVVTYNGAAWVKKCFGSLLSCGLPVKILAVDNASSDNTVQLLRTDFATVQVIETGANLGFGKANNIGLKMALDNDADYIFLLNQDAWLQPGCIEKLISCFESNLQMGIISPVHLNAAGDNFDKHFAGYTNEQHCPGFVTDRFFGREKTLYPIQFINAAAWMLSRNTLEKVGGFDPLFPHYGEDDDYVERVKYAGLTTAICPAAFIHHDAAPVSEEDLQGNVQRLKIHHLVQLKKISNTYRSNWLNFIKNEWDIQTTMLLFRKFKHWRFRSKMFFKLFSYYGKIKTSRARSRQPYAFLKEENYL